MGEKLYRYSLNSYCIIQVCFLFLGIENLITVNTA